MSLARSSAYSAAPIPLRLILALTFIWAGLGKLVATFEVHGERAALLANMGVHMPPPNPATPPPAQTQDNTQPPIPPDTEPEPTENPAEQPANETADSPLPSPPSLVQTTPSQTEPAPSQPAQTNPTHHTAGQTYTAADFPDPITLSRLHGIALLTYAAAHPTPDVLGTTPDPIWPEWAARDHWPVTLAWTLAITELAAGVLILVGLLSRISALALASVMLTAAWLTQIGPAIQTGDTLLGFLPNHSLWDVQAWMPLLWQLSLLAAAISVVLAGPGALSLDRALAGGRPHDDFDDEDDEDDE